MTDARTRSVMRALTKDGGEARFVGGAVRNALLGVPVTDVDIATPLLPEDVMRRLKAAGLGAVPTGIEHGTVTAIAERTPYEVTTLRRDVATDGRRAVVAFKTDWKEDAARRDFTMNALYADEGGEVFDYFGGIADLRTRKVRFVGDPKTRIREDYLRILRLFRFHAWYGAGEIDGDALAAAASEKSGIQSLSGERLQKELLRLLEAEDPVPAVNAMQREEILQEIIAASMTGYLQSLVTIQRKHGFPTEPLLRLAALVMVQKETELILPATHSLSARLRLSNVDSKRLVGALELERQLKPYTDLILARRLIYNWSSMGFRDAVMLRWAKEPDRDQWAQVELFSRSWQPPKFPLSGDDIKAMNITEGPRVGALLNQLEQEWIAADFAPNREHLLARLKEAAKSHSS